jgi:tetratricopeptide (TPR) repeat protein
VEAKEAYQRATKYYNLSDFQHALDSFKEAYLDYPDPSFLYNIGQCQRQLGQAKDAVLSYKAYLRERPTSPLANDLTTQIATLEQQIQADDDAARAKHEREAEAQKAVDTTPAITQVVAAPPPKPLYKKWWLWTIVGGTVVAVGLGVGLGVGLRSTSYPSASLSDGKVHF